MESPQKVNVSMCMSIEDITDEMIESAENEITGLNDRIKYNEFYTVDAKERVTKCKQPWVWDTLNTVEIYKAQIKSEATWNNEKHAYNPDKVQKNVYIYTLSGTDPDIRKRTPGYFKINSTKPSYVTFLKYLKQLKNPDVMGIRIRMTVSKGIFRKKYPYASSFVIVDVTPIPWLESIPVEERNRGYFEYLNWMVPYYSLESTRKYNLEKLGIVSFDDDKKDENPEDADEVPDEIPLEEECDDSEELPVNSTADSGVSSVSAKPGKVQGTVARNDPAKKAAKTRRELPPPEFE